MDWINVMSLMVGTVGLLLAIIQQVRIGNNKKKDYRRYWDIAKTAHIVMARVENIKSGLDKIQNCPSDVLIAWGKAHEVAKQLVRISLQNVFLQDIKFDDKEISHWKSTGLLTGYLLTVFNQMRLDPPKKWKAEVSSGTGQ